MTEEEFAALEKLEAEWARKEYETEPNKEFWGWAPTPLPKAREMMATADLYLLGVADEIPRFFDAGCGIGTKMALAERMFLWEAFGWDLRGDLIHVARNQLGLQNAIVGSLRSGRQPDYGEYDVVMTSRPFKDDEEETAWERSVQEAMKPGAVLIASFAAVKPYRWRWLYRAPWRLVAVKPLSGEQDHTQVNAPGIRPEA